MSEDIKERIIGFEKGLTELKEKFRLNPTTTIEFPQFRILPDEVLLALKVLENHKYKIMLTYTEDNNGN